MTKLNLVKSVIAQEMIAHQNDNFFQKITEQFSIIFKDNNEAKKAEASKERTNIIKLIKSYTNLNIGLTFDTSYPPCVYITPVNINSPIYQNFFIKLKNSDYKKVVEQIQKNKKENIVDFKQSKVYGVFEKIESPIYMSWDFIKRFKLSAEECAAILLHEVGHVFVNFEIIDRGILANQILAAVAKVGNDIEKKTFVLKAIGEAVGSGDNDYSLISEVDDTMATTVVMLTEVRQKRSSDLKSANYDSTAFEALADNFATRHGSGRHLVTGLDKLMVAFDSPERTNSGRVLAYLNEVYVILGALPFILGTFTFWSTLGFSMILFSFLFSGEATKDYTYDTLKVRYLRIKEQILDSLKNQYLPESDKKRALESIERINKAIESTKDFKPIFKILSDFLLLPNRRAADAVNLQRQLEELAHNELFAKAAELSLHK